MSARDQRSNPYVGLRPFRDTDSLYFFGREQQTAELLEILHQNRFLGIVGSSGSGKSSLVKAGLIPSLLAGFLAQDRDRWRIVEMKPGDTPIGNLAAALLKGTGKSVTQQARADLEELIHDEHTDAVVDFLKPLNDENANVFLLVDQFEEIFAFRGDQNDDVVKSDDPARRKERARRKSEAADFVDLLIKLAERREVPIYVALTMRTDFLGDCDLFYGFPEALNKGRYLVPRMTRPQLRDAIEAPATLMRARIAPRLLDHVLNALGDRFDRLPVLQHALLRTWDEWQKSGRMGAIDLVHFEDMAGGLEGALDRDAERALGGLDRDATTRIFKRLTDTDVSLRQIRSPARVSELVAATGARRATVEAILHRFEEDNRNFVHRSDDGKPDDPRVDISHESLIRQWDRLCDWVEKERQSRDQYRELVARAGKKPRTLLQDPELQTFVDWREKAKPSAGWAARYDVAENSFAIAMEYLDESVKERVERRAEVDLARNGKEILQGIVGPTLVLFGVWQVIGTLKSLNLDALQSLAGIATVIQEAVGKMAGVHWTSGSGIGADGIPFRYAPWWREDWQILVPLVAYGAFEIARRLHRRFVLPRITERLRANAGRPRSEGLEEAAAVHKTSYASTAARVGGFWIDGLFCIPMVFIARGIIVAALKGRTSVASDRAETFLLFAICFSILGLYAGLQISSSHQATLGMRAFGLFRTDLRGERLSFWRASAWCAAWVVSLLPFGAGFAVQPFNARRQTLHDRIAGTVVLRRARAADAKATPVGWPRLRLAAASLYAVVAVALVYNKWLRRDPEEVVAVHLNILADSVIRIPEGGERPVTYSLVRRRGDTISAAEVDQALSLAGDMMQLRASDMSLVGIDSLDNVSSSFALKGLAEGTTRIWVVLKRANGDSIRSRETVAVEVESSSQTPKALAAYFVFRERVESDTISDVSLAAHLATLVSTHGAALGDFGLETDLDTLKSGLENLMATGATVERLLQTGSGAKPLELRAALASYVKLAKQYRFGHGTVIGNYESRLASLDSTVDGIVLKYGVCRAPCNSEEVRETQFRIGDNVVIRFRYRLQRSGVLYVEWRHEGRMAMRQYSAEPNALGYRIWDQKNVSSEGEWDVRVLNASEQPVETHQFFVRK